MIYRLRIGQPKLGAWGRVGNMPNMTFVGSFYCYGTAVTSNKATEFSSFETAEATYSEFWNLEVVYQDSNGEWKPVNSVNYSPETISGEVVNDHICPSCRNTKCSKLELKCWRCGNKLRAT
jgi:hypothetical protein